LFLALKSREQFFLRRNTHLLQFSNFIMRLNMNLKTVLLLLGVSATGLENAEKEKRQTTSLDWSSILSQACVFKVLIKSIY
jgi:hypothetical protein